MFKFVAVSLSMIVSLNAMAGTSTVMSAGRVPAETFVSSKGNILKNVTKENFLQIKNTIEKIKEPIEIGDELLSDIKIVSEGVLQGTDISGQIITVIAAPLK